MRLLEVGAEVHAPHEPSNYGLNFQGFQLSISKTTMSRVIHFEIHADNPERAVGFYSGLFGWNFQKWDGPMPYWLITTGPDSQPGINGGMVKRPCPASGESQAMSSFVCTIGV